MIHLLSHCALVLAMRPGLRGFRLVLLVVFCCLALGANAGGGSGSALMLPAHAKQVQLSHATYLFEDPGGQLTLEDVLRPSNQARFEAGSPGLGFTSSAYWLRFYFLHSYYVAVKDPILTIGTTNYNGLFTSAIANGHIFGVQFHPEKSHEWGIELLNNFANL